MKKIIAFLLACGLFAVSVLGIVKYTNIQFNDTLKQNGKILNYEANSLKADYPETIARILDKNTVLMLGSSELPRLFENSHPESITHSGNSDFNIMMLGQGYVQSLEHAINAGGMEPYLKNNKIVLNLSPQWFTEEGVDPEAFSSVFSSKMLREFMDNDKISKQLKLKVLNRCEYLFSSYSEGKQLTNLYKKQINGEPLNLINKISQDISDRFSTLQLKKEIGNLQFPKNKESYVKFAEINFQELMEDAEKQGRDACTNNDFYIYDDYFDTYIKDNLGELKDSQQAASYSISPEYNDLKLFLDVCEELDLQVMLINIPVNGYWYDYTGFSKEKRNEYYQNIRDIVNSYNVQLLDLSGHEYTPYFLKDAMHLGWKGWVYIDEGVYQFYKED